ncbi:membrane-spanning 4-domains subfamily A member 12 [Suricata suricatta]|uniref:membrane-spanning 4-domains subfamily A member 12 n=1 Tax=Suricata suricatta TaxID=37032 RepID=UPI0011567441|nr:membrane-spanning 4-domains subfamily A member 12 [Suricata suricatta]
MSSQPTTQPQKYETILSPYPPSNTTTLGSSQPLGFTHPGHQPQSGQPPFFGAPGVLTNGQQGQGHIQVVSPATRAATTNFREQAKILGAIQILIGLMHIAFGIILALMNSIYGLVFGFLSFAFISGYTVWGGISFIATGALSILASKQFSPILVKSSLGMNIVSTISVFIGVTLLLLDASLNGILNQDYWLSGRGISAMLIIFSVLEFCINCTIARFANQAITKTNKPVLVIPNVFAISASARPRSDGHLAYAT